MVEMDGVKGFGWNGIIEMIGVFRLDIMFGMD